MRSYEAARRMFSFQEFLCKALIVIGVLVLVVTYTSLGQISPELRRFVSPAALVFGFPFGVWLMYLGFSGLVGVQTGRAGVDSAEYAQQSLKIAREQLEISQQGLKQGSMLDRGYALLQAAKEDLRNEEEGRVEASYAEKPTGTERSTDNALETLETHEHKGHSIAFDGQYYRFAKMIFADLDAAKGYIDQSGVNEAPKLGGTVRS